MVSYIDLTLNSDHQCTCLFSIDSIRRLVLGARRICMHFNMPLEGGAVPYILHQKFLINLRSNCVHQSGE